MQNTDYSILECQRSTTYIICTDKYLMPRFYTNSYANSKGLGGCCTTLTHALMCSRGHIPTHGRQEYGYVQSREESDCAIVPVSY